VILVEKRKISKAPKKRLNFSYPVIIALFKYPGYRLEIRSMK
jgi:hypothetical protein